MPLSTQEYIALLRIIHTEMEQLSNAESQLPIVDQQQLSRVLQYASQTVPEFEQCWNDISVWIATMTTSLERYHALASELLEEEDTVKLPALASRISRKEESPSMPALELVDNVDYDELSSQSSDALPLDFKLT
ncbi:MAG TPA: hypothetical protein VF458_16520 [Ktedonobacteraceae bacterium]